MGTLQGHVSNWFSVLEELSLESEVPPSHDICTQEAKVSTRRLYFKIPTQGLFYMLWNSCYQSSGRCACSTQGPQEGGFAAVAGVAHQGQGHLPVQLSCLDVRQAVWLTARQQQEISLSTDRQTDLAWIHTVSRHCKALLLVVTATSSLRLIFLWVIRAAEISCDQDRDKRYSLSQSCCFLVLLYPPLGHSSIFAPLTCKETSSK